MYTLNLTNREIGRLRQALLLAIDTECSYIEAHRTRLRRNKGCIENVIPAEWGPIVERTKRNIAAFEKLLSKINEQGINQ